MKTFEQIHIHFMKLCLPFSVLAVCAIGLSCLFTSCDSEDESTCVNGAYKCNSTYFHEGSDKKVTKDCSVYPDDVNKNVCSRIFKCVDGEWRLANDLAMDTQICSMTESSPALNWGTCGVDGFIPSDELCHYEDTFHPKN